MKRSAKPTRQPGNRTALIVAAVIAAVVIAILLRPFATAIIAACIAAFVFLPVYSWFYKKTKRAGVSSALTMLASLVVVIIPIFFVIYISIGQVSAFVSSVDSLISSDSLAIQSEDTLNQVNHLLGSLTGGHFSIDTAQIQAYILKTIEAFGEFILGIAAGMVSSIPRAITNVIVFLYVYSAILMYRDKLISMLERINPLGEDITKLYLARAGGMTTGMIRGQFVVAAAQGTAGALFLKIAGIDYFIFFALLLSVLSIIPLGGGIVTIPIGIIMLITGNITGGLFVLLTHFLVITNIDNVLRPMLVPKEHRLNSAITIISVLSGVVIFGFIGIVIGPVLMILAITTLETYLKTSHSKIP